MERIQGIFLLLAIAMIGFVSCFSADDAATATTNTDYGGCTVFSPDATNVLIDLPTPCASALDEVDIVAEIDISCFTVNSFALIVNEPVIEPSEYDYFNRKDHSLLIATQGNLFERLFEPPKRLLC